MKSHLIIALLSTVFLLSCDEQQSLEFEQKTVSIQDLSLCDQSRCPDVIISYLQVVEDDSRAAAINGLIQNDLGEMISSAVMPGDSLLTEVEPAVKAFVKSFQDYYGDFPDDALTYELEVDSEVSFQSESVVSLMTSFYAYTGGAHGYEMIDYLNLDAENGSVLTLDKLIEDQDEFKAFAELKFKEQMDMAPEDDINSGRFYFEDDGFYIPEIFGFTEEGMELYYATYEIGSYADGPVSIEFSWEEMEPWLSIPLPAL